MRIYFHGDTDHKVQVVLLLFVCNTVICFISVSFLLQYNGFCCAMASCLDGGIKVSELARKPLILLVFVCKGVVLDYKSFA